jgi:hypothetical protein
MCRGAGWLLGALIGVGISGNFGARAQSADTGGGAQRHYDAGVQLARTRDTASTRQAIAEMHDAAGLWTAAGNLGRAGAALESAGRLPLQRSFILRYYQGDKRCRVENRHRMAEELDLPLNALRNRALRLREKIENCVSKCISTKRA